MRHVCIVIPTYNEKGNIGRLIKAIRAESKAINNWKVSVLVVDDNSPDGTADVVRELQTGAEDLHLITGERNGLGAAYIRGFGHALKNLNPDYLMEMDADLQHNPADIKRFLVEADAGHQFIIGSRYISGADFPNWSFKRKVYSWGANMLARNIAGIGRVKDCTSGFRCIDANFLRSFDLKDIEGNGYVFQVSLLHAAKHRQLKIKEIPILFPERTDGESKLGRKDIVEFCFLAFTLRTKRYHWRKTESRQTRSHSLINS